jgi:hypothetical protein
MKANKPAIIALVLWLLFVASNAFAVFKPPYPLKAYPPDQIVVISGYIPDGNQEVGTAKKAK